MTLRTYLTLMGGAIVVSVQAQTTAPAAKEEEQFLSGRRVLIRTLDALPPVDVPPPATVTGARALESPVAPPRDNRPVTSYLVQYHQLRPNLSFVRFLSLAGDSQPVLEAWTSTNWRLLQQSGRTSLPGGRSTAMLLPAVFEDSVLQAASARLAPDLFAATGPFGEKEQSILAQHLRIKSNKAFLVDPVAPPITETKPQKQRRERIQQRQLNRAHRFLRLAHRLTRREHQTLLQERTQRTREHQAAARARQQAAQQDVIIQLRRRP